MPAPRRSRQESLAHDPQRASGLTTSRRTSSGLARVEGEGSLHVEVARRRRRPRSRSTIFEPPRFFEALLVGRRYHEAPDITSRICGICPVAYQMSACAAIEDACGSSSADRVAALRRLLYCGEWIQSHALHVYLLHAPDFLGCAGRRRAGRARPAAVRAGPRAQADRQPRHGDRRRPGRAPGQRPGRAASTARRRRDGDRGPGRAPADGARDAALATVEWVAGFDFPDVEGDYRFVALRAAGPATRSSRAGSSSSDGLDLTPAEFAELVVEEHVARSTALHARLGGRDTYLTGPLARYALNSGRSAADLAREAAAAAGLGAVCTQPVPQHRRACGRARLRLRRGAAPRGGLRAARPAGGRRVPAGRAAPAPARPRRRGACCCTATSSTPTGIIARPASCRPPRRTSSPSRPTCAGSSRTASTSPTRS